MMLLYSDHLWWWIKIPVHPFCSNWSFLSSFIPLFINFVPSFLSLFINFHQYILWLFCSFCSFIIFILALYFLLSRSMPSNFLSLPSLPSSLVAFLIYPSSFVYFCFLSFWYTHLGRKWTLFFKSNTFLCFRHLYKVQTTAHKG